MIGDLGRADNGGKDAEPTSPVEEWIRGLEKYATTEPEPSYPRGKVHALDVLTGDLDEIGECLIEDARGEPTRLNESLAERREQQASRGAPLVLDYLRRVTSVRGRDEVPHLREILEECIA